MRIGLVGCLAAALAGCSIPAYGQALEFCVLVNRLDAAGKLADYSGTQVRNGLCMATREVAAAIAGRKTVTERVCGQAAVAMYREFKRRFPREDAQSVTGRC